MPGKKTKKDPYPYGFDHTTGDGQKRLMAISMGKDSEYYIPKPITHILGEDYGADPIENGEMFRMVPSGDIVDHVERNRRLERRR